MSSRYYSLRPMAALGLGLLFLAAGRLSAQASPFAHLEFVDVPGGTFLMGSDRPGDEGPVRKVTVQGFRMTKTEITQEQFAATGDDTGFHFGKDGSGARLPAEGMLWEAAVVYCNHLSTLEGRKPAYHIQGWLEMMSGDSSVQFDPSKVELLPGTDGYRLPTEAEWEYAARGGAKAQGRAFIGGSQPEDSAWTDTNSGGHPHPVGTKTPNELGLFDMGGNVAEWVWDWYGAYQPGEAQDPKGPAVGPGHVVRGGGWFGAGPDNLRPSFRSLSVSPGRNIGFRVVVPLN